MQTSKMWSASTLVNARIRNNAGDDLGKIEDVVYDPETGNVQYVVSSYPVVDRTRFIERRRTRTRPGVSIAGAVLLLGLVLGLGWLTFLVATKGWDQTRQDVKSSLQSAAYAAKETSQDAALTTKVKTALSLSKRIPSDKINVDSEGTVVTLRGEVASDEIRDLAETVTRDVPGVTEVHNHLFSIARSQ